MTRLLWIDVETTGLDPYSDNILAVGMRLTTAECETIREIEMYIHHPCARSHCAPEALAMHEKSGLMLRVTDPAAESNTPDYVLHVVRRWLRENAPTGLPMSERPLVAGSTISFDRSFLRTWLPSYVDHVHYRSLDVSSTRELIRMHRPELLDGMPVAAARHTPLADIDDSMRLHRFLSERLGLIERAA